MKFDKKYKIHEAAAKEPTHYAISDVLFERTKGGLGRLAATNGCILVVVPVEDHEGDETGLVSRDGIKAAVAGRTGKNPDALIRLEKDRQLIATKAGMIAEARPDDKTFPDIDGVTPKDKATGLSINLSAQHLVELIKALGCKDNALDAITLTFQRDDKGNINQSMPVYAYATADDTGAYGLIMPVLSA